MTKWVNDNGWKVLVVSLGLAAAWGATKLQVTDIRNRDIPALQAADKEQSRAITDLEKADIGIKGSIDRNTDSMIALESQQKAYHEDEQLYRKGRDEKLGEILSAIEKRNEP